MRQYPARCPSQRIKASFKIRHTEKAADRVQQAREQLGLTWRYVTEFETQAARMINETLTVGAFRTVCDEIWKPVTVTATDRSRTIAANRTATLTDLFTAADTNSTIRGTRWAGYQAITEYLDHLAPVHGSTMNTKMVNRALPSVDGSVTEIKERAFGLLVT